MRILHVVPTRSDSIGGIESFVDSLASALTTQGVENSLVTFDGPDRRSLYIHHHTLSRRSFAGYQFGKGWRPGMWQGVDIIHLHAITGLISQISGFKTGIPIIVSTHGGIFHSGRRTMLKRAFLRLHAATTARSVSRYIASSIGDFDNLKPFFGSRLQLILNGVDIAGPVPAPIPERPAGSSVIIGRWSGNKRMDLALRTAGSLLRASGNDGRVTIIGRADDLDQEQIARMADDFVGRTGYDIVVSPERERMLACMNKARFIVQMSSYEGFGLTVIEGMARGCWPVLSDIPPFRFFHEDSGLGTIVRDDAFNPHAVLAQQSARSDPLNDLVTYADRYAWTTKVSEWADCYRSVIANHPKETTRHGN